MLYPGSGADGSRKSYGENINEAYRVFGNPLFVSTETSVSTESKFYGHNFYQFYFKGLEYDQEKFNGSYMDTS